MDRSDRQLVNDYLAGNKESLEVLFERNLKAIYSFVCRYVGNAYDAEDITQESFVKAWRNIKKFDQNKNFKTWIFAIAKNTALDFLKKKKTIPFSTFDDIDGNNVVTDMLVDTALIPSELLEHKDIASTLASAMENLSPSHRAVLFLRYNDHFTFREIAESLCEPLHTIKSQHWRALIKLKKLLTEQG